jgi:hypothetical protein
MNNSIFVEIVKRFHDRRCQMIYKLILVSRSNCKIKERIIDSDKFLVSESYRKMIKERFDGYNILVTRCIKLSNILSDHTQHLLSMETYPDCGFVQRNLEYIENQNQYIIELVGKCIQDLKYLHSISSQMDYNLPGDYPVKERLDKQKTVWFASEDYSCNVCLCQTTGDIIAFTRCGHNICNECIQVVRRNFKDCPTCRKPFELGDLGLLF